MMYVMEYVAFLAGIIVSWAMLGGFIDILLTLLVFVLYRSEPRFNSLYNLADDESTYLLCDKKIAASYADYLRLHDATKKSAYKLFRRHYDSVMKLVITRYLPIILLPAIPFWTNWYWYVIGVFVTLTALICYRLYVKRNGVGFYQRAMIFTIIDGYIKNNKQVK